MRVGSGLEGGGVERGRDAANARSHLNAAKHLGQGEVSCSLTGEWVAVRAQEGEVFCSLTQIAALERSMFSHTPKKFRTGKCS